MQIKLLVYLFLISTCSCGNPTIIDPFTTQTIISASGPHPDSSNYVNSNSIFGGQRDTEIYISNAPYSTAVNCIIANGEASLTIPNYGECGLTLQYDGDDNSMEFNHGNAVNLRTGGAEAFEIDITVSADCQAILIIQTSNAECFVAFDVNATQSIYYVAFSEFTAKNSNCDLTRVEAIELDLGFLGQNNVVIRKFATYEPSGAAQFVTFDLYTEEGQLYRSLSTSVNYPATYQSNTHCCSSSLVGGQRDMFVYVESLSHGASFISTGVTGGEWTITAGDGVTAVAELQYDGSDVSSSLSRYGLGGVDFSGAGRAYGFQMNSFTNKTTSGTISVYTGNSSSHQSCRSAFSIPENHGTVLIRFNSFVPAACDFSNVGAIELSITVLSENQVILGPTVTVLN